MRFQDPLGIRFVRDGGEMYEGHLPVLVEEVLAMLAPAPGSLHIDATLGGGGHTERILEAANPDGRVLGLDADPAAIARVEARLRPRFGDRLVLRQANFRDLATVAPGGRLRAVDGCLFDLGLSSFQLADRERGFGFRAGGPLDMRFDTSRGVPASELLRLARRRRADRALPALRRGAEGAADRPGHRRRAPGRPDRDRRGAGRARRAGRCRPTRGIRAGPIPRPASSRPCGSRSTRSSRRSRPAWPPRSTCSVPAAGSSS